MNERDSKCRWMYMNVYVNKYMYVDECIWIYAYVYEYMYMYICIAHIVLMFGMSPATNELL